MRLRFWSLAVVVLALFVTKPALAADVCYQLPFPNPNLADGWGSTAGRANPHRGVDFPQAANTPIPAVADGVVRVVTYNGCLGNVIVLEHADGMFSGYAHLIRTAPLAIGTAVSRGQTIGNVGTTGTCTTGNHLHLTISASVNGYYTGTTVDPYKYIQAHKVCSCDRTGGGLTFSCDGPNAGKICVNVNEPADPDSWSDNHLCSDTDIGLAWSHAGPIPGKDCTNVAEPAEKYASAWADNFICVAKDAPVVLSWSSAGPIAGKACVHWNEPGDPSSWSDNHLCVSPRQHFSAGGLTFSNTGPVAGKTCVNVDEPADPKTWSDNFLCSDADVGLAWSHQGPIAGMRCTNVSETAEHDPGAWADNFVCVPPSSPYVLTWSSAGPLPNKDCVRWYEPADLAGSWADNYLCADPISAAGAGPNGESGGGGVGPNGAQDPAGGPGTPADAEPDADAGGCSVPQSSAPPGSFALAAMVAFFAWTRHRRRR